MVGIVFSFTTVCILYFDCINFYLDLEAGDAGDWPLEWFCDQLSQDLFSTSWETRHGAATAIREILTVHGKGAGRSTYLSTDEVILVNLRGFFFKSDQF